jgi:hypothetical protein
MLDDTRTLSADARTRLLLMTLREALLMVLRGIEDYLGMPRSVPTKREKEQARC